MEFEVGEMTTESADVVWSMTYNRAVRVTFWSPNFARIDVDGRSVTVDPSTLVRERP